MRIGFVAPHVTAIRDPQLGGSQALLADIAVGLTERGHDVVVFAASGSEIEGVRIVDTGINPEMLEATFFRAPRSPGRPDSGDHDIARDAFAHVYSLVRGLGFDVVHNHAFDVPAIELAPADVPVVHTLHLPPTESIARALHNATATVACVSDSHARAWRRMIEVDVVLRNGVPVDRIPWSERAGEGLLFAGRFSAEKGATDAIEIARSAGTEITVVGSAYDERYAAAIRSGGGVHVLDALPRAQLWELMARSLAVLCPVRWDEPYGLVAAEAQAAGTPVIAFARGALVEIVADGVTGFLTRDVGEAAAAVSNVPQLDRAHCRKHAETHLSLERTLDAHEVLYAKLCA